MQQAHSVHGHEVIELLLEDPRGLKARELEEKVRERFGDDPRFHTCSGEGMTLGQLLAFLIRKAKVYEQDGRLHVDRSQVCQGAGGHSGHADEPDAR